MGATSALKGFRVQFLYSLYKIISEFEKGLIYQPEGKYEDLDIIDDKGNYIEVIQIKNKSSKLQFSDLFSKETSFFKRAEKVLKTNNNVTVKIVSFTELSNDLTNITTLQKKLLEKGFETSVVEDIIKNYKYEVIDETSLFNDTTNLLKKTTLFSNPKIAIELLIYWVYISGEKGKSIQAKELINNLEKTGVFINEQVTFNSTFNNTIIPLSVKTIENEDDEILKENFYLGVSAKYEHILANLDVLRNDKLKLIDDGFKETNLVFVYGASGQGKSALAYRYLKDFSSDFTVYELKISENLKEVYNTINSLEALCKGLNFPVVIYIDVKPQDTNWNEIVKELYGKKNLKFLITIRQEDWNSTGNLKQYYNFKDVELYFDKEEAKIIYDSLFQFKKDLKFTDFEESWLVFGNSGLLLEYVYLINQGNTLKSRLDEQVKNLRNRVAEKKTDELEILKLVCLSDNFNAKISYKKVISFLSIVSPVKYINDLQKEYLLQYSENKEYLIGLHPIRSKILCTILFDEDDYTDIYEYISNSLSLVDEEDLHKFILNSFDKGYGVGNCIKTLNTIELESWSGYMNIMKALMWKGIHKFIFQDNIESFNSLHNLMGDSWSICLPFDFSGVSESSIHGIIKDYLSEDVNQSIIEIHNSFGSENQIFEFVLQWTSIKQNFSAEVKTIADIKSLGEIVFWINYLKLENKISFDEAEVVKTFEEHSQIDYEMSIFINSLLMGSYNKLFCDNLILMVLNRLRVKNNLFYFEKNQESIETKYFFNPLNHNESDFKKSDNFFNETSVRIIEIIRNIFPDKESYSTEGVAIAGFDISYNPTIKNINKRNLPSPFLTNINSLIINLYNYPLLPDTWEYYIEQLRKKRKVYNECSSLLLKAFSEYFRTNDVKKFIKPLEEISTKIVNQKTIKLPKMTTDKWGYGIEEKNNDKDNDKDYVATSKNKYKLYLDYQSKFFNGIDNFLRQIGNNIINVIQRRNYNIIDEEFNNNIIFYNIKEALINNVKFQEEYNTFFVKYSNKEEEKLIETEANNLQALFFCWHRFYNQKGKVSPKVLKYSDALFALEKNNLTQRFIKERDELKNDFGLNFNIELNKSLNRNLIITCNVIGEDLLPSIFFARELVKKVLGGSSYFSPKKTFIDLNITNAIYIPLISGNPVNQKGIEINLNHLDDEDNNNFSYHYNFMNDIKKEVEDYYRFQYWNNKIELIKQYELIMGEIHNINFFIDQLNKIDKLILESDSFGRTLFDDYKNSTLLFLKNRIEERLEDCNEVKSFFDNEELYNKIVTFFNNFLKNLNIEINDEEFDTFRTEISSYYYLYADSLISNFY